MQQRSGPESANSSQIAVEYLFEKLSSSHSGSETPTPSRSHSINSVFREFNEELNDVIVSDAEKLDYDKDGRNVAGAVLHDLQWGASPAQIDPIAIIQLRTSM